MEGHKKTAELLIANGADVDLKDNLEMERFTYN